MNYRYCNDILNYSRWETREVKVGNIGIGGNNPIRIQSMTTTDTMDTMATVEESIRMIEAGCELIRITAPSQKEAENLANIKAELNKRGYDAPIIADIHYTPKAAEIAARLIEKVRVNPGNYADKKKFAKIDYTDHEYQQELDRIFEKFSPLVKICKEHGTAMRIGTNHGSLSDRILSRFGDTPQGMVESAMEFVRICAHHDYHNLILSMKASNPQIMIHAYRLLVDKMKEEGYNFPLHLGVTEAGDGEDGRIKSAIGIGALLEDGLGDTVRVSLTEAPENEAPVAKALVERYLNREKSNVAIETNSKFNPYAYHKRNSIELNQIGGKQVPKVIIDLSKENNITPNTLSNYGYDYLVEEDKWNIGEQAVDFLYLGDQKLSFAIPGTLQCIGDHYQWKVIDLSEYKEQENVFVQIKGLNELQSFKYTGQKNIILVFTSEASNYMQEIRAMFLLLKGKKIDLPVVIRNDYKGLDELKSQTYPSTDIGANMLEGFGDGIWLNNDNISGSKLTSIVFGILQATRTRISKTDYISCPSCGRTLFDLEETTAKIRSRTNHLKGLKIGIMGCIVNGPGEMADADYGYVGSGIDKITLYKGQEVVEKGINSEDAVDALIDLIKDNGDWVDLQ
jgi:(E)-4-hydroxy-3-methylbut-2-enyl-diphosphate synthase